LEVVSGMVANSVAVALAYLVFGLLISVLARKGWEEDWEESLLASVLGPPLFTLIAAVVLARFLWTHLSPPGRETGDRGVE
jgi:biotin transporter BioY